jgi:hypothetical protein
MARRRSGREWTTQACAALSALRTILLILITFLTQYPLRSLLHPCYSQPSLRRSFPSLQVLPPLPSLLTSNTKARTNLPPAQHRPSHLLIHPSSIPSSIHLSSLAILQFRCLPVLSFPNPSTSTSPARSFSLSPPVSVPGPKPLYCIPSLLSPAPPPRPPPSNLPLPSERASTRTGVCLPERTPPSRHRRRRRLGIGSRQRL